MHDDDFVGSFDMVELMGDEHASMMSQKPIDALRHEMLADVCIHR